MSSHRRQPLRPRIHFNTGQSDLVYSFLSTCCAILCGACLFDTPTFPAMDSELLVSASPPVHLTFSDNSMINATLYRDSHPVYTIATASQGLNTEIRSSDTSELLARITRRSFLPDLITFPNHDGGKEMRLSKWMRRCMLPDGSHAHGVETEMGNCLLKIHPVHRLALYTERDPGTPIAHWERATATSSLSLVLYPGTEYFYPKIIAAFTVSELKMRNAEQTDSSRRWS